jgi:O-antigen/teichoic acid export membrane protein
VTEQLAHRAMPPGRGIARNAGAQVVTFALRATSGVVLLAVLGHLQGPTAVGRYTFALQFTSMLTFLAGLGMQNLLVREVSRSPENTAQWVDLTTGLLLLSGGATVVLSLVLSTALPGTGAATVTAVGLAAVGLVGQTLGGLLAGAFYARERMGVETRATLVSEAGLLAAGMTVLLGGGSALGLLTAYAATRLLLPVALLGAYRRQVGPVQPHVSWGLAQPLLRRAVPFCLDDLLTATYVRVDVTLVQILRGTREVGLYTSATLLTLTLNILARVLNWSLYPRLSRTAGTAEFRTTVRTSVRLLMLIGLPLAVGPFLLGPQIMELLWGPRFAPALNCYLLLTLVVPIRFLGHTTGTALTAADRQTWRTWAVGGAALINVLLNLWLIPDRGFYGAGIATLATEILLTATYIVLLFKVIGPFCRWGDLLRPAFACAPLALLLLLLRNRAPLGVSVVVGAIAYAGGALSCRAVSVSDVKGLLR